MWAKTSSSCVGDEALDSQAPRPVITVPRFERRREPPGPQAELIERVGGSRDGVVARHELGRRRSQRSALSVGEEGIPSGLELRD